MTTPLPTPASPASSAFAPTPTPGAHALPGVHLRPALPDDALCLGALATQVFLHTYATQGMRPALAREVQRSFATPVVAALLCQPGTRWLVAERQQHLLGFVQVTLGTPHPLQVCQQPAELDRLYVQEPHTGRGLGRALLLAAEQLARDAGAQCLWLTPWVHNHRALRFYARQGYVDDGLTTFWLEGEAVPNRVLSRSLPPP